MIVRELIELLEPYKDNINDINGNSVEFDRLSIEIQNGIPMLYKFGVKYICDHCAEPVSADIEGDEY